MGKKPQDYEPDRWSSRDVALWTTAELAVATLQGNLAGMPVTAVPFALRLSNAGDEGVYAHGAFRLLDYRAPGDGSYAYNSSTMLATGRGAVPLMIGVAAVRAMGNAGRGSAAASLAIPRWLQIEQGTLAVSNYGFYLHTATAVLAWDWHSIHFAELIGPGALRIQGQSPQGLVNWIIESEWAELVFFFWAGVRNPTHPQYVTRTWLPEEWLTRAFVFSRSEPGVGQPSSAQFQRIRGQLRP
ncbi:hypothetical protein IV500_15460 [Paeniglutamicibacter antarcticus]|uniref:Uncharacterized protein n=1 Tax=Arthrobacter terrae TaxID=2935737 RepID=A0A931GBI4_9MICC|nr:hypothetical protein [Arthrobacter terrae]MBG0740772.1 hypothetical protein [Arthrobacter terrae]